MGDRIGIPMVLNISFDNNVEPVADSVEDEICCYLTTGLDKLAIGDFIIMNRNGTLIKNWVTSKLKIHQETHAFLRDSSPKKALEISAVVSDDIRGLWEKRLIRLCPRVEESKQVC